MSGATPRPLSPTATDTCPSRTQVSTLKWRGGVTPPRAAIAVGTRLATTRSSVIASPRTLVRERGGPLARSGDASLLLGPVTQHAGHRVEVLRQATELVGPTNRDADREIAVGDLGEAGLELVQGTPHAPAHHENQEGHQQRTQPEPQDRVASHLTGRGLQRALARREICPSDPAAVGTALLGDPQQLLDGHESRGRVRPATALELRHAFLQDVADARQRAVDAHQGCPELLRGGGTCRDPQRDRKSVV